MAMAKTLPLILLVAAVTLVEAADPPAPAAQKWKAALPALDSLDAKMQKAVDGVMAAAPPEKQTEVEEAAIGERLEVTLALSRIEDCGNERKVETLAAAYEKAADVVIAAPPAEKLKVMKEVFRAATMDVKTRQAFDSVVAAAPPEKRSEAVEAVLQQQLNMDVSLGKATASGDENNFVSVAGAYEKAADAVIAASPAVKLGTMSFAFNGVVAPDLGKCPAVDKLFCETYAKTEKAFAGVIATGDSPRAKLGFTDLVLKQRLATDAAINKAYAEGDKAKIAKVLTDYAQAADAVAAAAPPEKLKAMEQKFSAVAAANRQAAAAGPAAAKA